MFDSLVLPRFDITIITVKGIVLEKYLRTYNHFAISVEKTEIS
jgi:hypothetical protein